MNLNLDDSESLPENTLGERVKKLRLTKGLTIKELGKICGISPDAISYIEKDKKKPNMKTLNKLSKNLDTTNEYLLGADKWPEDTIGQIIKKYRYICGLTQRELAEKCNIHPATVKDYEDDRLKGNSKTLNIIYKILGYK